MVKTNEASTNGTQSTDGVDGTLQTASANQTNDSRFATAAALSLGWQLALVVIVPIIGGYMLDQHYHRTPLLTLAGLVLALIGAFGVLSRLVMESGRDGSINKPESKV